LCSARKIFILQEETRYSFGENYTPQGVKVEELKVQSCAFGQSGTGQADRLVESVFGINFRVYGCAGVKLTVSLLTTIAYRGAET
jgi:hypothetical protein